MTQTLTPGRWRGLLTTSTHSYIFTILAFDQRGSYRKMLPEDAPYETAVATKQEVVATLSTYASAVLLDPQYGLSPALHMAGSSGLLLALEESGYTGDSTYRGIGFAEGWTIAKIKQMGASAVKLLAYYNPESGDLASEIEGVIRSVAEDCHKYDLPLFLEPLSYSLDPDIKKDSAEFAEIRPRLVAETARRLSRLNADVLKMEFPIDAAHNSNHDEWAAACQIVSENSAIPWVLLSAGVDYETFEHQARIACEAGASGFLAGRAIWKEAIAMSPDGRRNFLGTTAVDRICKLSDIAMAHARPWTDFYTAPTSTPEWYANYPAP